MYSFANCTPTNTATLTPNLTHTLSPTFTPSMTPTPLPGEGWLVFVSNRPVVTGGQKVWNIYAGHDDGTLINLTNNDDSSVTFTQPVWSPNFTQIAYSKKVGSGKADLCLWTLSSQSENCDFDIIPVMIVLHRRSPHQLAYVRRERPMDL